MVVLIFPPVGPYFRCVELGFVQLAGHLRGQGYEVDAVDANRDWFRDRARVGDTEAASLFGGKEPAPMDQLAFLERLRGERLLPPSWWLDDVVAWLDEGAEAWAPWLEGALRGRLEGARHIGLSTINVSQTVIALAWARWLRRRGHPATLSLGGVWATTATDVLDGWRALLHDLDLVCTFEGEHVFTEFLEGGPAGRVRGPVVPLNELVEPAFDLVNPSAYPRPELPLLTRRRCTWSGCSFCAHVYPNDPRPRDVLGTVRVVDRLERYQHRYGISSFDLADLTVPTEALVGIATEVTRRGLSCRFTALARADAELGHDQAKILAAGGVSMVCVGLESPHEAELRHFRKGIDLAGFESSVGALHAAGIEVGVFVLHLPGQSEEALASTITYLRELGTVGVAICQRFRLSRNTGLLTHPEGLPLRPSPGVDLWLDVHNLPCIEDGLCSQERYEEVIRDAAGDLRLAICDPLC